MIDVIFIGDRRGVALFREAGIESYAPARRHLAERVIAERARCRVLAMTDETFAALPEDLARELREGELPHLEIVSAPPREGPLAHRAPAHLRALAAAPVPGLRA